MSELAVQSDVFAGTPHQRPRPTRFDKATRRLAVEAIIPEVEAWLSQHGEPLPVEDRVRLVDLLTESYSEDGFALAQEMEREGYLPDAQLVEILDNIDTHSVHAAAVRVWLAETGAVPRLPIGAVVSIPARRKDHAGVVGEIVASDEKAGTYLVCCASLGHVREGLGTHGLIFAWEDVEAANGLPASVGLSASTPGAANG